MAWLVGLKNEAHYQKWTLAAHQLDRSKEKKILITFQSASGNSNTFSGFSEEFSFIQLWDPKSKTKIKELVTEDSYNQWANDPNIEIDLSGTNYTFKVEFAIADRKIILSNLDTINYILGPDWMDLGEFVIKEGFLVQLNN